MRPLGVVAGVLAALVAVVYGWRLIPGFFGGATPAVLARRALEAESEIERQQAAVDLASAGRAALGHLRRVLEESGDADVRAACAQGLGDLRDYGSLDLLVETLGDEDPLVRARAAAALRRLLRRDLRFPADGPSTDRDKAQAAVRETCAELRAAGLLEALEAGKTLVYYYDRNTQRVFEAPADSEALLETPSGPFQGRPAGALASVFSCSDCGDPSRRYVGYLLAPEETARKHGEKIVGAPPDEEARMVVCRPGDEHWVYLRTGAGDAIVTEAARRCGGQSPISCRPGW